MTSIAAAPRSLWRYFPWFVALALALVVGVNATMAYIAIKTFPGTVVDHAPVGVTASSKLPVPKGP